LYWIACVLKLRLFVLLYTIPIMHVLSVTSYTCYTVEGIETVKSKDV